MGGVVGMVRDGALLSTMVHVVCVGLVSSPIICAAELVPWPLWYEIVSGVPSAHSHNVVTKLLLTPVKNRPVRSALQSACGLIRYRKIFDRVQE